MKIDHENWNFRSFLQDVTNLFFAGFVEKMVMVSFFIKKIIRVVKKKKQKLKRISTAPTKKDTKFMRNCNKVYFVKVLPTSGAQPAFVA